MFSVSELEVDDNLLKEELLSAASIVLRLNTKIRPHGRVASSTSRQLVGEFVVVVRDLAAQLNLFINRRVKVSGILEFGCATSESEYQ